MWWRCRGACRVRPRRGSCRRATGWSAWSSASKGPRGAGSRCPWCGFRPPTAPPPTRRGRSGGTGPGAPALFPGGRRHRQPHRGRGGDGPGRQRQAPGQRGAAGGVSEGGIGSRYRGIGGPEGRTLTARRPPRYRSPGAATARIVAPCTWHRRGVKPTVSNKAASSCRSRERITTSLTRDQPSPWKRRW